MNTSTKYRLKIGFIGLIIGSIIIFSVMSYFHENIHLTDCQSLGGNGTITWFGNNFIDQQIPAVSYTTCNGLNATQQIKASLLANNLDSFQSNLNIFVLIVLFLWVYFLPNISEYIRRKLKKRGG